MNNYEFIFSVNIATISDRLANFCEEINKRLNDVGCKEKLNMSAEIVSVNIKTEKELSEQDKKRIATLIEADLIKTMPKYDIRLSEIRKSEQSVEQSAE
jgi:hypothetical protein